ncbi:quinone-dependent dihydroorotate dehydrogenase [Asticcacaulis sp. SL142]|uniref:quinone-dependent dihydroorotate dehydrogenase n=1 Tax=Asticcacaulis sp. SL142 TaxID=2995155 RepID=UPI00226D0E36|nr:quinone-dependent dihydroorotate dehydrogenase [Asticcacaulis sp. SL142]WAC49464.1 quinone-dependent dihydroorotate dehydrogenase [Asticcacaulis sp. SL142]
MDIFKPVVRALHGLDGEDAHTATLHLLKLGSVTGMGPSSDYNPPELSVTIPYDGGTLEVGNCVGLAAGFDKNADVPLAMIRAGFGFVECGTVTPLPQAGNPRPRLFRLKEDEAVINRMGFNNKGLEVFSGHLSRYAGRPNHAVIGANIGANKDATDRMADYVTGLKTLWGLSSYFTVNISSPNTPGLRALQGRGHLDELLSRIAETRHDLKSVTGTNYPIFLKIAPDLDDAEIVDTVESAIDHKLDGLIISNTTLERPDTLRSAHAGESGGLSGEPLFALSTQALRVAYGASGGKLMLIGAGGINSGERAYAKIRAGASLVQIYSALVYEGSGLTDRIKRDLVKRLKADGFTHISQAVGQG